MKRLSSCPVLLGLVLSLFAAGSANAMFVDRFVAQWRAMRAERRDADLRKIPLFQDKFLRYPANNALADEGTFKQKLNHFDGGDARTFEQRYWINSTYASGADAPVIYYICGEWRCSAGGGFAIQVAKELRAHAVTLEHRYYGDSVPVSSYSAAGLKYLTTDQALADLDAFQAQVRKDRKLTGAWIAVGGSYAGSLSAYYRLAYPKKIAGSLASSGPVQAKAEFEEYDRQIATIVPPACLAAIQKVTAEVESDLSTSQGRAAVKKLFGSSEIRDDVDFLYVVADMAALAIQYGTREEFCATITGASDAKAAYAKIGLKLFADFGMTPVEDTAQGNMSENPNDYRKSGMRQWLYQSCTEYGYWQIANRNPRYSSRSKRIDLPFHNDICTRLFGIHGTVDTRPINRKFYEPIVRGRISRTFFTNGTDDPWQHLSVTPTRRNVPRSASAMLIQGAAHCDDLGGPSSPNVEKAQNKFRSLVKEWLEAKGYRWSGGFR